MPISWTTREFPLWVSYFESLGPLFWSTQNRSFGVKSLTHELLLNSDLCSILGYCPLELLITFVLPHVARHYGIFLLAQENLRLLRTLFFVQVNIRFRINLTLRQVAIMIYMILFWNCYGHEPHL